MTQTLLILGCALAGGLLVLHGVGKTKETSERMLEKYAELLIESQKEKKKKEDEEQFGSIASAEPG